MGLKSLKIDLSSRTYSLISSSEGEKYIGGEPLSFYLLGKFLAESYKGGSYLSINSGPINGLFPYTSKSVVLHLSKGLVLNKYIGGGSLGSLMNISGVISIEILGISDLPVYLDITPKGVNFIEVTKNFNVKGYGLAGRRSTMIFEKSILVDGYFSYGVTKMKIDNNLCGFTFSAQGEVKIPDLEAYLEVVNSLNSKIGALSVTKSFYRSCMGCPMGCALSKAPESGNVSLLPRSLVACSYAESLYNDVPTVFSCLSVLGYEYTHEHLELFSDISGGMIRDTYNRIEVLKDKNSISRIL